MNYRKRDSKVIVLSGRARSGKDTAMNFIKNSYEKKGLKVINLSFASTIKEYAKKIVDWNGDDETKPRDFLQLLGTDIIRKNIDDEFFIKRMLQDIEVYSYFFDVIIISDARFRKEIETLKSELYNVIFVNIVRPDFDGGLSEKQKNHSTEADLDGYSCYDYEIINDGNLDDLEKKVVDLMESEF